MDICPLYYFIFIFYIEKVCKECKDELKAYCCLVFRSYRASYTPYTLAKSPTACYKVAQKNACKKPNKHSVYAQSSL